MGGTSICLLDMLPPTRQSKHPATTLSAGSRAFSAQQRRRWRRMSLRRGAFNPTFLTLFSGGTLIDVPEALSRSGEASHYCVPVGAFACRHCQRIYTRALGRPGMRHSFRGRCRRSRSSEKATLSSTRRSVNSTTLSSHSQPSTSSHACHGRLSAHGLAS